LDDITTEHPTTIGPTVGVVFLSPFRNGNLLYSTGEVAFFDEAKVAELRKIRVDRRPMIRLASKDECKTGMTPERTQMRQEPLKVDLGPPTCVRFDKSWQGYNVGELAWFPKSVTDQLVDAKAAHEPTPAELKAMKTVAEQRLERAKIVPVRLLRQVYPSNKGETVWVSVETAESWATKGIAERVDPVAAGETKRMVVKVTKAGDGVQRPEVPARPLIEGETITMNGDQATEWIRLGIAEPADPADLPVMRGKKLNAAAGAV